MCGILDNLMGFGPGGMCILYQPSVVGLVFCLRCKSEMQMLANLDVGDRVSRRTIYSSSLTR
jgi:hypothetical protein